VTGSVRLGVVCGNTFSLLPISRTMGDCVHQQWMQLVEAQQLSPAGAERLREIGGRVVASKNFGNIRRVKQGEHRQVGQAVPAVGCRIDHHGAICAKQQVARPQVAVNPGRRQVVVEHASAQPIAHPTHRLKPHRGQVADLASLASERQQPQLGVKGAPRIETVNFERLAANKTGAIPAIWRRAERRRAGLMRPR